MTTSTDCVQFRATHDLVSDGQISVLKWISWQRRNVPPPAESIIENEYERALAYSCWCVLTESRRPHPTRKPKLSSVNTELCQWYNWICLCIVKALRVFTFYLILIFPFWVSDITQLEYMINYPSVCCLSFIICLWLCLPRWFDIVAPLTYMLIQTVSRHFQHQISNREQ